MKNYQFKTDIHCNGCAIKIEKALQNREDIHSWKVDWDTKILQIQGNIQDITAFEDEIFEKTQVYIQQIKE